jgi:hypothetical protein
MKRSIAARSWSISALSSSSLAPRSSAWRSASSALRRLASASEISPSYVAQIVVGLGAHQRPVDAAQPQICAGLGREFFRRQRQRVERGEDERPRIGVEREIAALLDQRPRQRLGEDALGQAQCERLALADIAAFVAGDQRHLDFGAGPGMIGQILDGLGDAGAGARLRQDQREIGRPEQWMRAFAVGVVIVLAGKRRLRLGHPVIVFEPVGQQQRAAALLLGILGQFDGRRLVGDDIERPGQIVAGAAQGGAAGRGDGETMLVGASRRMHGVICRRHAADAGNIEAELACRAHHQRRIDRHGDDTVGR